MRSASLALTAWVVFAALPAMTQSRESMDVRILELDATVLDRAGKPVEGLTRDDFEVRTGKREVPITNFFAVRKGVVVSDEREPDATQSTTTAPIASETSIPTSLIIFIDDSHLSQRSHTRAMKALQRYVSANIGGTMTATLVRYNRELDVRVRPTERAGPILRELDQIARIPATDEIARERRQLIRQIDEILMALKENNGRTPEGETPETLLVRIQNYAEHRVADVDHTLDALERAIELASAFSGRKVLLYVSDGLPQSPGLEVFEYFDSAMARFGATIQGGPIRTAGGEAMRFDRSGAFRHLAQTAQRANVAIFSFDAAGLRGEAGRGPESSSSLGTLSGVSMYANERSGLQFVAEETGGQYITNENNIDTVLARMSEQFSSYYSIGIHPQRGAIRIMVRNHPELRVIAARRMPPRTREDKLEQDLRSRLYTRAADNPLDATLGIGRPVVTAGQCVVPVRLLVPQPRLPHDLTPQGVELRMVMLNEANDESGVQVAIVPFESARIHHLMRLRIRPEKLVLSIAVTNPVSGETTFLQGEIDGTACR